MAKGHQLTISIFLITASIASIALGSETSPYSINFDLRNMDGFSDNVISAGDIEAFIKERYPGSPMLVESDTGNCFINAGQKNNVNPAFLVATACLEGGFGTLGWAQSHPECHNTFGYGIPSGTTQPDDYNCMDSWCVMIERVASVIAHGNNYYTKGLYTVSQVRGKYAASPNSDSIASLMNELYAFSNLETATSNTVVEKPSSGMNQSQASNSLGLPIQIRSPVIGPLEIVSDINNCSGTKWCFNQHKTGNGGIGHITGGGVGKADDTYAWDANLNTPQSDADNGKAVYSIASGVVSQTYGGKKNADDIGSSGQVLIEHSNQETKWWSGYLHLANIQVKKGQVVSEDTILGDISQVGADNNHLHFVIYTGENSEGQLKSFDTQIVPRNVSSSVEGDAQETSIKPPIVLTLYVHEGSADGPIIPSATVRGQDASGNGFQQTTDSNGYVAITGNRGRWSFSVSADGYETNNWDQEITETDTKDAFLQKKQSHEFGGVEFPNGITSFADHVVSYNPCNGVEAPRNNPNNALGSPDYKGVDSASYVSLGNAENACDCGSLVLEFIDNALVDVPGNDLYVYEVGPSVEASEVFISTDGQEWIDLGKIDGSLWGIDIHDSVSPGQEFHFVKLCDYPDGNTGSSPSPGPDIDAVGAIGNL